MDTRSQPAKALHVLSHVVSLQTTTALRNPVSFGNTSLRPSSSSSIIMSLLHLPFSLSLSLSRPQWMWLISNYDKTLVAASKLSPGSRPSSPWLIISLQLAVSQTSGVFLKQITGKEKCGVRHDAWGLSQRGDCVYLYLLVCWLMEYGNINMVLQIVKKKLCKWMDYMQHLLRFTYYGSNYGF